jgi:hypothetical protein
MEISRTAMGLAAAACVAVGAAGAYLVGGSDRSVPEPTVEASSTTEATPATALTTGGAATQPAPAPAAAARAAVPAAPAPRPAAAPSRAASSTVARAPATAAPSAVTTAPASVPVPAPEPALTAAPEPVRTPEPEPVAASEPAPPEFEELYVPADSVVGLQIETSVTSENAALEDEVVARVTRDVRVDDRVAIPAGARAHGEVTLVERGGRLRERARLGVRFTSIVLEDGSRMPIATTTIFRDGDPPSRESAAKIGGGALGGAIIGGILGGAKGAVIGSTAGAGAGTAAVLAGGRNAATLPGGTPVTIRLSEPLIVTVDRR